MSNSPTDSGGLGVRVLAARQRLGWAREALAYHAGISWSAIVQIETGRRRNVRPTTLGALARALGVSLDYLVEGVPSRQTMFEHSAFPYGAEDQFQHHVGDFLSEGVERSEATLAVTNRRNIKLLREYLGTDARDVEFIDSSRFLTTPAAAIDGFRSFCEEKLERGAIRVRIVGQPIWAGRSRAEIRLWTRFESLINLVLAAFPATAICPYDERSVAPEILRQAHVTHPHIAGAGGSTASPNYVPPERFTLEHD